MKSGYLSLICCWILLGTVGCETPSVTMQESPTMDEKSSVDSSEIESPESPDDELVAVIQSVAQKTDGTANSLIIDAVVREEQDGNACEPNSNNVGVLGKRETDYLVMLTCPGGSGGSNFNIFHVDASQNPVQIKQEDIFFLGSLYFSHLTSTLTHVSWIGAAGSRECRNYYWDGKSLAFLSAIDISGLAQMQGGLSELSWMPPNRQNDLCEYAALKLNQSSIRYRIEWGF